MAVGVEGENRNKLGACQYIIERKEFREIESQSNVSRQFAVETPSRVNLDGGSFINSLVRQDGGWMCVEQTRL